MPETGVSSPQLTQDRRFSVGDADLGSDRVHGAHHGEGRGQGDQVGFESARAPAPAGFGGFEVEAGGGVLELLGVGAVAVEDELLGGVEAPGEVDLSGGADDGGGADVALDAAVQRGHGAGGEAQGDAGAGV